MEDYNSIIRYGMSRKYGPTTPTVTDPVAERKKAAMHRAQDLEKYLSFDHLAALLELFEGDVNVANSYMNIDGTELRKAWVRRKLAFSGLSFMNSDGTTTASTSASSSAPPM
jgi:hypothetical protein